MSDQRDHMDRPAASSSSIHRPGTCQGLRPVLSGALLAGLFSLVALTPALGAPQAEPADLGLGVEPGTFSARALPPLPDPATFPVQLVLDDDAAETVFGFFGSTARQFLWLNRFGNPGPFTLEEIWVLFPSVPDVPLGGSIQLAVYLDPDGDPATGAQLLATFDETIQAIDGNTFSVYTLTPSVTIDAAGDVLIGAVNRYFMTGVDPPPTRPAALDTTASQNRSYFALWAGDAPNPPDLGTATVVDVLDGQISGNFMIRGFGTPLPLPPTFEIPTLGGSTLVLLGALLGLAGAVWLRWRA